LFLDLLKNLRTFLRFWHFLVFLRIVFIEKVIDRIYGSRDHGWLSIYGGLTTIWQCGRSKAQEVIVTAQREREREMRSSRFSPMMPLRDGVVEMAT
jgi:hypothetical protein